MADEIRRPFAGKVVVVTGATGGFGRAIARRFAIEGACLMLSDLNATMLDDLTHELRAEFNSDIGSITGDISGPETSQQIVRSAVERFGRLDLAINNAGIAHPLARLSDIAPKDAERVIAIDLLGVFFAMRAQIPMMQKQFAETGQGGAIVNVASVAGLLGAPGLSVYAAAKHGVVGLTKSAALEYAMSGVRINAVCPSFAPTPMVTETIAASGDAAQAERIVKGIPMRRLAAIDEVVETILFASSPANSFMTGQALAVDGGLSAG